MLWPWRERTLSPREELDRSYREQRAEYLIQRIKTLSADLKEVVDELHTVARRFSSADE